MANMFTERIGRHEARSRGAHNTGPARKEVALCGAGKVFGSGGIFERGAGAVV